MRRACGVLCAAFLLLVALPARAAGGWYLMQPPWTIDSGPTLTVRGNASLQRMTECRCL